MAQFRVGQMVKVVDGPRAGEITTIASGPQQSRCSRGPAHAGGNCFCKEGLPIVYRIMGDAKAKFGGPICAPAGWLRPYYPPAKWEAGDEWIRRLTKQRERA